MEPEDETIDALVGWAGRRLGTAGVAAPRREAWLLLAYHLGEDASSLRLRNRKLRLQAFDRQGFQDIVMRRMAREPLAYITGRQGFWTLDLEVSKATLIPRADSEALIESLLVQRPDRMRPLRILDLGTGTGCLLLAALSEYPFGWGLGIDLSPAACQLAARNARAAGLASRSAFCAGCWSDPLSAEEPRFDLVLSNPPYIRSDEIAALMPEVSGFEPALALDGGVDGLDAYRIILSRLGHLLKPGGVAILELGASQLGDVQAIVAGLGLVPVTHHADLQGVARAIVVGLAPAPAENIWHGNVGQLG